MLVRTEWLSNIQTQSFFSRLCLRQRSKIQQESDDVIDTDDEDDYLIEASAPDVDEECFREARNTVMDEIGLKHPVLLISMMCARWQEKQGCLASKSRC